MATDYEIYKLKKKCKLAKQQTANEIKVPGFLFVDVLPPNEVRSADPIERVLIFQGFKFVEIEVSDGFLHWVRYENDIPVPFKERVRNAKYLHFYRTDPKDEHCEFWGYYQRPGWGSPHPSQCIGTRFLDKPMSEVYVRWISEYPELPPSNTGLWGGKLQALKVSTGELLSEIWIGGYRTWTNSWGMTEDREAVNCVPYVWELALTPGKERLYGLLSPIFDPEFRGPEWREK